MSNRSRTPGLLETYLELPSELSLTLVTSTLGCSANWLTARLAISALQVGTALVLVSWTQDKRCWRDQLKATLGMDISRLPSAAGVEVVDRLGEAIHQPTRGGQSELEDLEKQVSNAIAQVVTRPGAAKAIVVLDQPDVLLATHPGIESTQLDKMILRIRSLEHVHAVILSCTADLPGLNDRDGPLLPIESRNVAFLVQQAHMATRILSCRELTTGSARDVSGILRITQGGASQHVLEQGSSKDFEQRYIVQRDGAVKLVE